MATNCYQIAISGHWSNCSHDVVSIRLGRMQAGYGEQGRVRGLVRRWVDENSLQRYPSIHGTREHHSKELSCFGVFYRRRLRRVIAALPQTPGAHHLRVVCEYFRDQLQKQEEKQQQKHRQVELMAQISAVFVERRRLRSEQQQIKRCCK